MTNIWQTICSHSQSLFFCPALSSWWNFTHPCLRVQFVLISRSSTILSFKHVSPSVHTASSALLYILGKTLKFPTVSSWWNFTHLCLTGGARMDKRLMPRWRRNFKGMCPKYMSTIHFQLWTHIFIQQFFWAGESDIFLRVESCHLNIPLSLQVVVQWYSIRVER